MRSARSCFNLLLACLWFSATAPAAEDPASTATPTPPTAAADASTDPEVRSRMTNAPAAGRKARSARSRKPKPINALRIHVEARRDLPQRSLPARVGRENPLPYNIEKLPIIIEQNVEKISLVDQPGGFQVRVKFDSTGTRLLESYTAAAAGRHLIVATEIEGETRWLAAPLVRRRIGDGVLSFTPDASREEMERLVRDLTTARRKEKRNRWID